MRLKDKVAVVTGSGRNIGREMCVTFAREGADVVVNVRSNLEEGRAVVDAVESLGRKALLVTGDVSKKEDVYRMFDQVFDTFGKVDILVNNAGVRPHTHFLDITEEEWRWVLEVGLNGAFYCTKAVAPSMVKQRSGCIINVSGRDGFLGRPNRAHGTTVKAGLHGFTKALACDLGPYGVRANTVVPCLVETSRPKEWYPNLEEEKQKILPEIPLGRFATVQDVANAALFLVSDEASYLTGQVLHVNGGLYKLF